MHLIERFLVMSLILLIVVAGCDDLGGSSKYTGNHILNRSWRFPSSRSLSDKHMKVKKRDDVLFGVNPETTCILSITNAGLVKVDCSYRQISDLSKLKLTSPEKIDELDLEGNCIKSIPSGIWVSFHRLTGLNLMNNELSRLESFMFFGLTNLNWLSLQGNRLTMTRQNFPAGVFSPLRDLKILYLWNNSDSTANRRLTRTKKEDQRYPDWALASLVSLTHLYIDGIPDRPFGPGFKNLTQLTFLSMNGDVGFCNLSTIHNSLFENVSYLRNLTMHNCGIRREGINSDVLRHLKNLNHLDVSNNVNITLDGLIFLLISQINSTKLTHLNMNMVVNPYSVSRCVSNELARSLPRSLTHLYAASNNLEIVSDQVFELLPKNLSYLDLDDNRFFFGTYLQNMSLMANLQILKLNGYYQGYNLPTYFAALDQRPVSNCTISTQGNAEKIVFKLPPKLERLEMNLADLSLTVTNFSFDPNNSLKYLSLHRNNIPFLVGFVTGLHKVETLDLSRNNIEYISEDFFRHWNIQNLNLSNNNFNSILNRETLNLNFPKTLRNLDLSNTNLGFFDMNFSTLTNLETLNLTNSHVRRFVPNLQWAKNMKYLDLSDNFLYMLRPSVTETMDSLLNLTVDLSGNNIGCYCDTLEFIDWLVHYPRLTDKNLSRMTCDQDNNIKQVPDFRLEYQLLRRQCKSNLMLLSICTALCVSLFLLNAVFMAYRFRWKLRFWYYSAYLSITLNKEHRLCQNFQADVNIAYCEDDEDFAEETLANALEALGLRVHISGRDTHVGTWIFKDIVETVQTCRRTLVVLTPEMLACNWCQATVNLAAQEAVSSKRTVLVFLVAKPVQSDQLGASLLFLIQSSSIFFFPPKENWDNGKAMRLFWTKLARDLY